MPSNAHIQAGSGTATTATAPLTTTNGVTVAAGDVYVVFPDGTTWASDMIAGIAHTSITNIV